jgi:NADPH:quinone reductase-like Zn-dependent oxidoreductase
MTNDVRRDDLAKQVLALTGGREVDAAIDTVASREPLEACLGALGRYVTLAEIGQTLDLLRQRGFVPLSRARSPSMARRKHTSCSATTRSSAARH